jgi:glycosyltransferase involved in cell wall biosynthesis
VGSVGANIHLSDPFEPTEEAMRTGFRVSAIVSTYNGERFIRGCLEDLVAQTLFARGGLQIVVVNSGSTQNEDASIQEYVGCYPDRFIYLRTERETLYAAWNRAIRAAGGTYLTNSNVDDRHHPEALERMAEALDSNGDVALMYADSYVVDEENLVWDGAKKDRLLKWPEFDRDTLFEYCYIGQAPMWRRELHEQHGYFDDSMISAGDYDFWLRLAKHHPFLHLAEPLGLYLERADAISLRDLDLTWRECEAARDRHWDPAEGVHPKFRRAAKEFARLKERVSRLPEGVRVALYGAGKHTERMLPVFRYAIEPHGKLVGILDDSPKMSVLDGLGVVQTMGWMGLSPEVVVISSDTYEMTMYTRARAILPGSVQVWRVYHTQDRKVGVAV